MPRSLPRPVNTERERARLYRHDKTCAVCSRRINTVDQSAYLETPDGPQLTHANGCFAIAVAKVNPSFSTAVALSRAPSRTTARP